MGRVVLLGFVDARGVFGKEGMVLIYVFLGLYCCREEEGCGIRRLRM